MEISEEFVDRINSTKCKLTLIEEAKAIYNVLYSSPERKIENKRELQEKAKIIIRRLYELNPEFK